MKRSHSKFIFRLNPSAAIHDHANTHFPVGKASAPCLRPSAIAPALLYYLTSCTYYLLPCGQKKWPLLATITYRLCNYTQLLSVLLP